MIVARKPVSKPPSPVAAATAVPAWKAVRLLPTPARPPLLLMLAGACFLIIIIYSRLVEVIVVPGLGVALLAVLLPYGLVTSRWDDWGRSAPTALMLALTAWMMPCAIFGDWQGGSVAMIVNFWSRVVGYYLLVASMARDLRSTRWIMSAVAFATGVIAILGLFATTFARGRLAIATATLANANDLAVYLMFGLPFCVWCALDRDRKWALRIVMLALSAIGFVTVFRTGSRMGMVAMGVAMLVIAALTKGKARILLVIAMPLAAYFVVSFLPEEVRSRYEIIKAEDDESAPTEDELAAMASAGSRWQLFVKSLQVTARHPVFGVGPGNFANTNAANQRYCATHNSYTQMSSECGLLGAGLFIGLVYYALSRANRLRKAAKRNQAVRGMYPMAFCLLLAGVAYATSALFGSVAYSLHLPVLAALVLSLERLWDRALAAKAAPAARA